MSRRRTDFDLQRIRRKLADAHGRHFWRGLEEIANTAEFRRFLDAEFPALADSVPGTSRRDFLRLMGASMALAGLSGCGRPPEEAVPYVEAPERIVPGKPRYYATAVLFEGYAQPVLGETHAGRPTKLEGNPEHPMSGGATDAFTQAAVLQLYDPDRSQAPTFMGRPTTWDDFDAAMAAEAARRAAGSGAGLRILTGNVTSPTMIRQIDQLTSLFPQARWHAFEPVGQGGRTAAARLSFGRSLDMHYRLDAAAVVVSLEDDFLGPGPAQVRHVRGWAAAKVDARNRNEILRLHVVESTPTLTGAAATTRRAMAAGRIPALAIALARELIPESSLAGPTLDAGEKAWVATVADELKRHRGRSLFAIGPHQPPEIQSLGHLVNERLGNVGTTVTYSEPVAAIPPDGEESLGVLAGDMAAGRVETLFVFDANPAYTAPADLDFVSLMKRVPLRIHAGPYSDETAAHGHWHVPTAHPLESWGDARAVDGTATVVQPLVEPFYSVRSVHEIFTTLLGRPFEKAYETVRETWRVVLGSDGFEERWKHVLHDGFVSGTAAPPVSASARTVDLPASSGETAGDAIEVVFRPDPSVWDGRFANIGWLQELPKPLTKVTWDNIVAISPRLGEERDVRTGDVIELELAGRKVAGPAWIMPGQAARTATLFLGYGRWRAGRVAQGVGYDPYRVRTSGAAWLAPVAFLRRTSEHVTFATTQLHYSMEGFDFVRTVTMEEVEAGGIANEEHRPTLYPQWEYGDPSWGMAIDLDLCAGCNACVVACQAENNIPVVGKEQVALGREMHWLRVDRYYSGSVDAPETCFQPVPCMHCEKAPCEMGCPVNATVHGPEGLNQMVYNRCIGTRTCSSFCPYKVRRFNWHDYTGAAEPSIQALHNPDVTVRARGVMEKCTYCIQRISAAHIEAEKEGRKIREGEVRTACQAACPSQAIVFGNIADPDSVVSKAKRSPRNYSLLGELNTRPRTTYLARLAETPPGRKE